MHWKVYRKSPIFIIFDGKNHNFPPGFPLNQSFESRGGPLIGLGHPAHPRLAFTGRVVIRCAQKGRNLGILLLICLILCNYITIINYIHNMILYDYILYMIIYWYLCFSGWLYIEDILGYNDTTKNHVFFYWTIGNIMGIQWDIMGQNCDERVWKFSGNRRFTLW